MLTICDELHETERPKFIDMLVGSPVNLDVTVQNVTENSIHYKVSFSYAQNARHLSPTELEKTKDYVLKYFLGKFDKLSRILRSAVGGDIRNLTVTIEVEKIGLKHLVQLLY